MIEHMDAAIAGHIAHAPCHRGGRTLKHVRLAADKASTDLASAVVTLAEGAHYEPLQMAVNGALCARKPRLLGGAERALPLRRRDAVARA